MDCVTFYEHSPSLFRNKGLINTLEFMSAFVCVRQLHFTKKPHRARLPVRY